METQKQVIVTIISINKEINSIEKLYLIGRVVFDLLYQLMKER